MTIDEASADFFSKMLGKDVLTVLKDGKKLFGSLLSVDRHGTIALRNVTERVFLDTSIAEEKHPLYVIRYENIQLIGMCKDGFDFGQPNCSMKTIIKESVGRREQNMMLPNIQKILQRDFCNLLGS